MATAKCSRALVFALCVLGLATGALSLRSLLPPSPRVPQPSGHFPERATDEERARKTTTGAREPASPDGSAIAAHEPLPASEDTAAYGPAVPRIFGNVVERNGARVAGALVRLRYRAAPSSDSGLTCAEEVAAIPERTLEVMSDAQGEFRFELPAALRVHAALVRASSASLQAAGEITLRRVLSPEERYAAVSHRTEPLLQMQIGQATDRLVGTVVIEPVGSVSGRVLDRGGLPLAGASVRVDGALASTDELGSYLLSGLPIGQRALRAEKNGFAISAPVVLEVEHGGELRDIDIELDPAATIRGMAVDARGAPVPRALVLARVDARFHSSTAEVRAVADAHGCFEIRPDVQAPHRLLAYHPGHEEPVYPMMSPYESSAPWHSPGAVDVRVPICPTRTGSFRVVDAFSSRPIPEFGICVVDRPWGEHSDSIAVPPLQSAPDGTVVLTWTADHTWFHCHAPGYAPASGSIELQSSSEPQRIELSPGAILRGRIQDGAYAQLRLGAQPLDLTPPETRRVIELLGGSMPVSYELPRFQGQERILHCDELGRFEVRGLAPGLYRLDAFGADDRALRVEHIEVKAAEVSDLGELQLSPLASIEGTVRSAPGLEAAGMTLWLDGSRERRCVLGGDGRFRFTGLFAGRHRLRFDEMPLSCLDCKPIVLDVAQGERHELAIDLSEHRSAWVDVQLRGASGDEVYTLESENAAEPRLEYARASAKSEWRARVPVRCAYPRTIRARARHGSLVGEIALPEALHHGQSRAVEIELHSGALTIALPHERQPSFELDSISSLLLSWNHRDAGLGRVAVARFKGRGATWWPSARLLPGSDTIELGPQRVGDWLLHAKLSYRDASGAVVFLESEHEFSIREGETTRVQL